MVMEKPHVVMLPYPGQGHINPMLQLAKLLHFKGSYITFINTVNSHSNILNSQGPGALQGLEDFRFETVPDGQISSRSRSQQQVSNLCFATYDNCRKPLEDLIVKLNNSAEVPLVTCIIYNGLMDFAIDVAEDLKIPALVFWTTSACGFMGYFHLEELVQRGYAPLKDESYLRNGYLDTAIDWIPGMKDIRLRDLSSFMRTLDANDFFLNLDMKAARKSARAQGLILNTFDSLETEVLKAFEAIFQKVYTIGPLEALLGNVGSHCKSMKLDIWGEDPGYKEWLDSQRPNSVIYVNFGSIATISLDQLKEFAWGLVDSKRPFLMVLRPDLLLGEHGLFGEEFIKETKERKYISSWCSQKEVLSHPSVAAFLTHCGWNSTLESICSGVPMICWPGFAEQHTNTRYVCKEWGIGLEIDREVKREQVTYTVKELMEGEKGEEMRRNTFVWRKRAEEDTTRGGTSYENLERLVMDLKSTVCL